MADSTLDINWRSILLLLGLWLLVVVIGVRVLDALFPRLRRGAPPTSTRVDQLPPQSTVLPLRPRPRAGVERLPTVTPESQAYWRTNLRTIGVMLVIWAAVSFLPALWAPWLNQFQILTGFPLGYYMGSQGSLIVFLGLVTAYAWRTARLDARFRRAPQEPGGTEEFRATQWRTGGIYIAFTAGFVLFAVVAAQVESVVGLPVNLIGWAMMIITLGVYAVIGVTNRAHSLDEYFVAGRRIPAFFNGMAIGADWMSAASFISMAGTLWLLGYEGLAYIMGWTGGYVLLALLLAPYLRKFGQFTLPDFIAARYDGNLARVVSAIVGVIISFTYVTAQVAGIGIIMSRFLGVQYLPGVMIGLGAVLFCSYLGGMRAITWTQVAQCIVLLLAYLAPIILLSLRETGVPFPQAMYGEALQQILRLEREQGLTQSYIVPFNNWTPWNFFALMLCLMLGTAGMPHILVRFYTVPDVGAARRSVSWALLFICLLYLSAPAYAAFARWEMLQNVVGRPVAAVPEWARNWRDAGLLSLEDQNSDGVLQFEELKINPDLVVLATPEIVNLPHAVGALVAAGGLAAALSTADGLLMVIASAFAHDIYARTLNPGASARTRLLLGRAMIFSAAVVAALIATRRLGIIVQLVAWAFSIAAATFFPILVLGIFWKRANGKGAISGMLAGLAVTLVYMVATLIDPSLQILGITDVAAGIFGVPVNFLVTIIVSKMTAPPSESTQAMVDSLRQP